ncbi:MAG: methionyl-tRNA formyltransferase [Gammaproteobacteria bacterium]
MTTPLATVFAGTPEFAVPSLEALLRRADVVLRAVYTQPDRPAGRGRRLTASPVKRCALAAGLPVEQPETLRDAAAQATLAGYAPDLLVVAAYGLLLPDEVLALTPYPLNVHASLLPRWRGAAPVQRALLAGDAVSGISIMRIVRRLDAGPVWLRRTCPIGPDETAGSLHDKLARLGAEALAAALDRLAAGDVSEQPQDETGVTYAAKLTAADRALDFGQPAVVLERQVRALNPLPGARARLGALEIKVLAARVVPGRGAAGTIVAHSADGIDVATAHELLRLTSVQPPGRQAMSAAAFLNGYGDQL